MASSTAQRSTASEQNRCCKKLQVTARPVQFWQLKNCREAVLPSRRHNTAGTRGKRNKKVTRQERTFASSISGETGGLSEREPPPLRGPLLCESRPEVSGATSCCRMATQQACFRHHVSERRQIAASKKGE